MPLTERDFHYRPDPTPSTGQAVLLMVALFTLQAAVWFALGFALCRWLHA